METKHIEGETEAFPNAKPKAATTTSKLGKTAPRSSRATARAGKLFCRYCGSDDISPSFKKRSDARCRACFKKRYGSAVRSKEVARRLKARAAK